MKFLRTLLFARRNLRHVLPLARDQRVPLGLKLTALALAVLIVSPIDVLGDIPIVGLIDDGILLTLLASGFTIVAQRYVERATAPGVSGLPVVP